MFATVFISFNYTLFFKDKPFISAHFCFLCDFSQKKETIRKIEKDEKLTFSKVRICSKFIT